MTANVKIGKAEIRRDVLIILYAIIKCTVSSGTIIGAKSKHVYRQMLNITRNMGCTHLARAEPLFSVFIIRRDTQFLIRPLGRVGIRKVTQHSI